MGTFWADCLFLFFKAVEALSAILSLTFHRLKMDLFVSNIKNAHKTVKFMDRIYGQNSEI